MKKITYARLSSEVSRVEAPSALNILSFKQHLDGPRVWFETDEEKENVKYEVKQIQMGGRNDIPAKVDQSGANLRKFYTHTLPINSIILGVLFNKSWGPILFFLIPNGQADPVKQALLLAGDHVKIPAEYHYHSTSLKPNWEAQHLYCKK